MLGNYFAPRKHLPVYIHSSLFQLWQILNETLCSNIPKSSWQITFLQHHIHCANYETILFKWYILQLRLFFFNPYSICKTPFNSFVFYLHNTNNMNWIPPQKRHKRIPSNLRTWRKTSSLKIFWEALGSVDARTPIWCWYTISEQVYALLSSYMSFPLPQNSNSNPFPLPQNTSLCKTGQHAGAAALHRWGLTGQYEHWLASKLPSKRPHHCWVCLFLPQWQH